MKKILLSLTLLVLLSVSCSKEKRLNKDLQGSWVASVWDGAAADPNVEYKVTFSKTTKKEGTGTITLTNKVLTALSVTQPFEYSIDEDKVSVDAPAVSAILGLTFPAINEILTVTEHSSTSLKCYDKSNSEYVFTKK